MSIDINKLRHAKRKSDGSTVAQCPACAAEDHDQKGEHLIVYPDGAFGCVVNEKNSDHNKLIHQLVGFNGKPAALRFAVKPFSAPPTTVIMRIATLGASRGVQKAEGTA